MSRSRTRSQSGVDISQEVSKAVQSLKADIERLTQKVNSIEASRNAVSLQNRKGLFGGMSTRLIVFIIVWPFVAQLIVHRFFIRRQ